MPNSCIVSSLKLPLLTLGASRQQTLRKRLDYAEGWAARLCRRRYPSRLLHLYIYHTHPIVSTPGLHFWYDFSIFVDNFLGPQPTPYPPTRCILFHTSRGLRHKLHKSSRSPRAVPCIKIAKNSASYCNTICHFVKVSAEMPIGEGLRLWISQLIPYAI